MYISTNDENETGGSTRQFTVRLISAQTSQEGIKFAKANWTLSGEFELKFPELSRAELGRLPAERSLGISIFELKPS